MNKKFFRNTFLAGIFTMLPLVVTMYILRLLYRLITSNFMPIISKFFSVQKFRVPDSLMGIITVIVFVSSIFLVGLLVKLYTGRVIINAMERTMASIPLVRTVYNVIKQMIDSFGSSTDNFEKVVLVTYPKEDMYCIGYVVRNTQKTLETALGGITCYNVFVPTAPNPTSGFIIVVPVKDCIELAATVDEGVKFILSVGLLNFSSDNDATKTEPIKAVSDE